MTTGRAGSRRTGFTLIELLVVIAIIALLVSILVPSLKKARDLVRATVCASNMRNLGVSALSYSGENDGRVPLRNDFWLAPAVNDPPRATAVPGTNTYGANQVRWFDALGPYLGLEPYARSIYGRQGEGTVEAYNDSAGMLWCASDRSRAWKDSWRVSSFGVPITVMVVYREVDAAWRAANPWYSPGAGDAMSVPCACHNFLKPSRPSDIVLLGEAGHQSWYHVYGCLSETNMAFSQPTQPWMMEYVWSHGNGPVMNYLFFDAHVERLEEPPHDFDYRVTGGEWADGSIWACEGTAGFLAEFHDGKVP